MPYITQDKRKILDPLIKQIRKELVNLELDDDSNNTEGNLNYLITSLLHKVYGTPTYREINDAVGLLECIKLEYYRRVAVPYENLKEFENGPISPNPVEKELMKNINNDESTTDDLHVLKPHEIDNGDSLR